MPRDKTVPVTHTTEPCRLYLIVPEEADAGLAERFEAVFEAGDIACVLLPARMEQALGARLKEIAQAHGAAVLIEGDMAAARRLGADGIHIAADETLYAQARAGLGGNAIVGAGAGLSRHAGLMAAEAGADYVAFGAPDASEQELADLIAWWAEIVEVPCVAWNVAGVSQARVLAELGADFIAVGDAVWRHPVSPAAAVHELTLALARAKDAA